MDSSAAKSPPTGEVHALHDQALGNLRFIRQTMEGAGFFTAVPGTAGITMGAIGILAAVTAALPPLAEHWLLVWLIAAGLALAVGTLLIAWKAMATGITIYSGPARRFVLVLSPALLAGAILTTVLVHYELTALVPGVWLLLYGAAVLAASVVSLPLIAVMGGSFMLLGGLAFVLPIGLGNVLLGAGFGGLHIVFGVLIAWRHHG